MKTALLVVGIWLMAGYWIGFMAWNNRALHLYKTRVCAQWGEAIQNFDLPRCNHWRRIAESYELQNWGYMLNPWRWITCWNWKPESYKSGAR